MVFLVLGCDTRNVCEFCLEKLLTNYNAFDITLKKGESFYSFSDYKSISSYQLEAGLSAQQQQCLCQQIH